MRTTNQGISVIENIVCYTHRSPERDSISCHGGVGKGAHGESPGPVMRQGVGRTAGESLYGGFSVKE